MENKIKIEDLKKDLYLGDYGEYFMDYSSGYICDIIMEIADNQVPIYTSEIWEEASKNQEYIEEALQAFGTPTDSHSTPDLTKIFQQGLFYKNEREIYDNLEETLKFWAYDYIEHILKIEEITEEQNDKLLEFDFEDNNEELENLIRHIENIFKMEENEENEEN